jgi:TrmH family RNA methyltransferase
MLIDSPQNQWVKLARALHVRKGREEHALFLAEGPRVVQEALSGAQVTLVAFCEDLADPLGVQVAQQAADAGIEVARLSERAFSALSDAQHPQGIAALVRLQAPDLEPLRMPDGPACALILLDVQDPGNVGTMIRTADAFGADAVILAGHCADVYEPKVVRATAGSLFHLPVLRATWQQAVDWAQAQGVDLVATALDAGDELGAGQLPRRLAAVIGNEAHGLPPQALAQVPGRLRIPMSGHAESLNAAVAAAILLWERQRQLYEPLGKDN